MTKKAELMPGTLDMLVLRTLDRAPMHGYGIALSIKQFSADVLTVEEGSLYPALQEASFARLGKKPSGGRRKPIAGPVITH